VLKRMEAAVTVELYPRWPHFSAEEIQAVERIISTVASELQ
jgi:hypothetical protein